MTLRTFHAGGIAGNMAANASIVAKNNARLEFEELRTVDTVDEMGEAVKVVVGRLAEVRFIDVNTGIILSTHNVPYVSKLYAGDCKSFARNDFGRFSQCFGGFVVRNS